MSLIDLPPTLLDAAGIDVPAIMQGRSVMPLLRGGKDPGRPDDVFVQFSEDHVGRAVRTQRWKYSVVDRTPDSGKQPGSLRYEDECLYDLQADPYELTNLVGLSSHREVVRIMRERLNRRLVAAGESAAEFVSAPERPGGQRRVAAEELDL
ncbi:DUF4976 domain-containing protein [Paenibacillus sp. CC-CFT747]|nr:DUF4976 domain-containing protein [Paenibacillus sp. CC-CFT747]